MTPEKLWQEFILKNPLYKKKSYDVFTFGDKPDVLLQLILLGQKTATCCIYRGGKIAQSGDISIVLNSLGQAQAIIETTKTSIIPFNKVNTTFAQKEGEGNKTLASWRQIHKNFWGDIAPDTLLECEEFKLLYPKVKST